MLNTCKSNVLARGAGQEERIELLAAKVAQLAKGIQCDIGV